MLFYNAINRRVRQPNRLIIHITWVPYTEAAFTLHGCSTYLHGRKNWTQTNLCILTNKSQLSVNTMPPCYVYHALLVTTYWTYLLLCNICNTLLISSNFRVDMHKENKNISFSFLQAAATIFSNETQKYRRWINHITDIWRKKENWSS